MHMTALRRFAFALAAASALAACQPTVDLRGNLPTPESLAMITLGQTTEDEVMTLLGTPSSQITYGQDIWLYISWRAETVAFFKPEIKEQKVYSIVFTLDGKVQAVHELGLEDARRIELVSRETPSAGKDFSILEQLVGNVGRFSKDAKEK